MATLEDTYTKPSEINESLLRNIGDLVLLLGGNEDIAKILQTWDSVKPDVELLKQVRGYTYDVHTQLILNNKPIPNALGKTEVVIVRK